jgi:hypothetical protein
MNDLENLILMANIVAKPWKISVAILTVLLFLSVCANVYLATQTTEITFDANENSFSTINQKN